MASTYSALELRQDGDLALVKIKAASAKPALKDIQTFLKKKATPAVLATYPYGDKRITFIGYMKGKESELSQHQLHPPCAITEIYGTMILIAHSIKSTWDQATSTIVPFSPAEYELFYEKACSGELEEEDDAADEDEEKDDDEAADAAEEEEEVVADDDDVADAEEDEVVPDDEEDEVIEEAPRPRAIRKVAKIDPQQLQFQYKSVLVHEAESSMEAVVASKIRQQIYGALVELVGEHCTEDDLLDLERGIYNATLEEAKRRMVPLTWEHASFQLIYKMISKRIASNFQPNSYLANGQLMERWKEGEFTLDQLGQWAPYELMPSQWKDLKDQQFRRDKRIQEGNLAMATDRFRCSQCKKKMCSYYELQTRSADEPMTIFISCLNCGKHWKQ